MLLIWAAALLYPKPVERPTPFETLAFCPRTRARKRRRSRPPPRVGGAARQNLE
jgi:hypothetical protein